MTGHGNRWTRERVTSLRSHHRLAVYKPANDGIEPWLNLSKAARFLHVAPRTNVDHSADHKYLLSDKKTLLVGFEPMRQAHLVPNLFRQRCVPAP